MPFYAQFHEYKPVPQGIYRARVDKVEPHQSKYGEMVRWTFTIIDASKPDLMNTGVSGLTSTKISSKSKLYTWLQAFGILLEQGQQFDLESLLGRECRIRIKNTVQVKDGNELTFSNVDAIAPCVATTAAPAAAAPAAPVAPPASMAAATNVPKSQLKEEEDFDF